MIDWLLLEYDEDVKCYVVVYYLFIFLKEVDIVKFGIVLEEVEVNVYDIVLNGYELGGGLIRIYDGEL